MDEEKKSTTKSKGLGKHKCKICKKKFSEKAGLDQHVQLHSSDKPYACHLCSYTGKTQKYLTRHVKLRHVAATAHECSYCGKKFHYRSKLNEHLFVHTNSKPYKCEVCGKGFNSSYSLGNHVHIHTDSKPFKCLYCDYACRDSSTLRKHHERHTGLTKIYQCATCLKSYKRKSELRVHVSEVHLNVDVKTKPCQTCGKMFRSTTHLTVHMQRVHDRIYETNCDICGVKMSNKYNMEAHLRSHLELKPFLCGFDGCNKRYKDKSTLKKHSIIHYPEKQYVCEICNRRFTRIGRYRNHQRQHQPRIKSVICDYCGVGFYTKNYLRIHIIQKHLLRKRFICDECGFCAYNKPGLVRHIRMGHDSELDRQCKICNKIFKKHIYLKSHYWNTHFIKYKTLIRTKKTVIKEEPIEEPDTTENLLDLDKHEMMPDSEADRQAAEVKALMLNAVEASSDNLETLFLDLLNPPQQVTDENEYLLLCDSACEDKAQRRIKHMLKKAQRREERKKKEEEKLKEDSYNDVNKDKIDTISSKDLPDKVSKDQHSQDTSQVETTEEATAKVCKKTDIRNWIKIERKTKAIDTNLEEEIEDLEESIQNPTNERSKNENTAIKDISYKNVKKSNVKNTVTENITSENEREKDIENGGTDQQNTKINFKDSESKNKNLNTQEQNSLSEVTEQDNIQNIPSKVKKKKVVENKTIAQRKTKTIRSSNKGKINRTNVKKRNKLKISEQDFTDSENKSAQNTLSQNKLIEINKSDTESMAYLLIEQRKGKIIKTNTQKQNKDIEISKQDAFEGTENENSQDTTSQDSEVSNDIQDDTVAHNNSESTQSKQAMGIKFNSHQCYECFKLFETKEKLLDHCKEHYNLCNETILKKCPLCDYVTNLNLARHMKLMHKVDIKIGQPGLKERENESGPRYFYNVENEIVNKIDVIPSIKHLNKRAYMKLDKLKRLATNKNVQKTKLVKKDGEWIVEKRNINLKADNIVIPDLEKIKGDYFGKLKKMATLAKNDGKRFMYPCNKCEKICQTLAALKLHYRHHDPNKKPFKPKVWKHKMNGAQKTLESEANKVNNSTNRYEKPKPIVNKHKCDPKLKEFYENNIKGGDIEFWQFLKIYNKMTRENVNDFKDLENRTEFGNHIPEKIDNDISNTVTSDALDINTSSSALETNATSSSPLESNSIKISTTVEVSRLVNKNVGFKRVIRINRKEYNRRNKIKQMLREQISKNADS